MERPSLKPALTLWDLTAIAINGVIGAGIFGLPSVAARLLGASSPIAFVLCAIVVSFLVLCFAEVASRFSETGGPYVYCRPLFGRFVAFEVAWCAWLARLSSYAANSNLALAYLAFFFPSVAAGTSRAALLVLISVILAAINIRGVVAGARFGDVFAVVKATALALFCIGGLAFVDWTRFSGISISSEGDWGRAMLLVLYAFTAFEDAVIPAGEAKDPRKHIGWALIMAVSICAAIYCTVQVVAVGTLPNIASSERPLADAAQRFLGPAGAGMIAVLACVSVIGNISGKALITPRLTYAFSQEGDFPAVFGRLHPVYRTPAASIILFSVVATTLAVSGQFIWLATMSVLARLVSYLVTCLALPLLRRKYPDEPPAFRIPGGSAIAVAGILSCGWLFTQASLSDLRALGLACAAGALIYLLRKRRPS